jgi:uncharacterized membrane protein
MDYDVIQPNEELLAYARKQLHGVRGQMACVFFILFLLTLPNTSLSVLNSLHDQDPERPSFSAPSIFLSIVTVILTGPFYLGLAGYFLKRIRGEETAVKNMFDGFKRFGPSLRLMLLTTLFTTLWMLLLIIPGIIKAISYSMAFFIMHDHPEMTSREALQKSKTMMKGYKGKIFNLGLSFIGWILLGVLTLGIGLLWVYPYMYLSIANFYENLKRSQE